MGVNIYGCCLHEDEQQMEGTVVSCAEEATLTRSLDICWQTMGYIIADIIKKQSPKKGRKKKKTARIWSLMTYSLTFNHRIEDLTVWSMFIQTDLQMSNIAYAIHCRKGGKMCFFHSLFTSSNSVFPTLQEIWKRSFLLFQGQVTDDISYFYLIVFFIVV